MAKLALQTFTIDENGHFEPFGSEGQWLQHKLLDLAKPANTPQQNVLWIPSGESVQVAGRDIGGMVYVTHCKHSELTDDERFSACINTTLPVAKPGVKVSSVRYQYSGHYHDYSAVLRASYLEWLKSGRKGKSYKRQFVPLYFSGLERRFMFDDSSLTEKKEILAEVKRLLDLYKKDPDIAYTLSTFLDLATTLIYPNNCVPLINKNIREFSLSVEVGLGRAVMQKEHLTADWALSWYLCTLTPTKTKLVDQCFHEFTEAFRHEFKKKYPKGLYVKGQRHELKVEYHSTSADDVYSLFVIRASNGQIVPDVTTMPDPLKRISEIASVAEKTIGKYSAHTKQRPREKGTLKALRLLPVELRLLCSPDGFESLKLWGEDALENKDGLIELKEFINASGGQCDHRPTPRQFKDAADTLALIGIGVCEDPRYSIEQPPFKPDVTLFSMEPTAKLEEEVRDEYKNIDLAVHAGLYVAAERIRYKCVIGDRDEEILYKFIDTRSKLTVNEKNRLTANIQSYLESSPTFKILKKPLEKTSKELKETIQSLVLELVAKGGSGSYRKIEKVKEIYREMGLDIKKASSDVRDKVKKVKRQSDVSNEQKKSKKQSESKVRPDEKRNESSKNEILGHKTKREVHDEYEKEGIKWIPNGKNTTIAGQKINGMVYVSYKQVPGYVYYHSNVKRAVIYARLPIAKVGKDYKGRGVYYWRGYSDMTKTERRTYLEFLSSTRDDRRYDTGYILVYFEGLQHRFFAEGTSEEEKKEILAETKRLMSCYGDNEVAERQLEKFILFADIVMSNYKTEPVYDLNQKEFPLVVTIELGKRIDRGEKISSDWALSWFLCHRNSRLRTPVKRCDEEFNKLFQILFKNKYPDGMKVKPPKQSIEMFYYPVSSEFRVRQSPTNDDGTPVSYVIDLKRPLKMLQEIADKTMDKLGKLSNFLGRKPQSRNSLLSLAYMPEELKDEFCLTEIDKQKKWLSGLAGKGGVNLMQLLKRLGGEKPEKVTPRMLQDATDSLAIIGFSFAPDLSLFTSFSKPDEKVYLYHRKLDEFDNGNSQTYTESILKISAGAYVASANGEISRIEMTFLRNLIDSNANLTENERNRLRANLKWFQHHSPTISFFRKNLSESLRDELKTSIRKVIIGIVHSDGIVHNVEIARIEQIYKLLGFNHGEVYSDMHAGEVLDGPVSVGQGSRRVAGEKIPPRKKRESAIVLDDRKIDELTKEGEQVREVLGEALGGELSEHFEEVPDTIANVGVLGNLDDKNKKLLLELIEKEKWSGEEVKILTSKHQTIWQASLEEINEWASYQYDDILIEEYDGYNVNETIVKDLKKHLKE